MISDHEYKELIQKIPDEIVKKLIKPLAEKEPIFHLELMAFLSVIHEKGYCIKKRK